METWWGRRALTGCMRIVRNWPGGLSALLPPLPAPHSVRVRSSPTWEEDGLRFLLVVDRILDGADHVAYSSICDQKRRFHVEEPVSVLDL